MSNRKKPAQPQPGWKPTMTVIPSTFVDQYEFSIDNGVIGVRFGRRGETHADVTMPLSLMVDLITQVRERVVIVDNAPTPEAK